MLLGWAPAGDRDWAGLTIVVVVVLLATSPLWLWALSDLTGGWYG